MAPGPNPGMAPMAPGIPPGPNPEMSQPPIASGPPKGGSLNKIYHNKHNQTKHVYVGKKKNKTYRKKFRGYRL
jgi:hypothetical protein